MEDQMNETVKQRVSSVVSAICIVIAAGGFGVTVFLQNWQGRDWGAVPRLALMSALMVTVLAGMTGLVIGELLRPSRRLVFAVVFAGLGILSAWMMNAR
jgi:cadmium resistance protein CadD (predicted permease)